MGDQRNAGVSNQNDIGLTFRWAWYVNETALRNSFHQIDEVPVHFTIVSTANSRGQQIAQVLANRTDGLDPLLRVCESTGDSLSSSLHGQAFPLADTVQDRLEVTLLDLGQDVTHCGSWHGDQMR